ncbi:teleost multiple tissue opsin 3a [Corythoichthys intestinalis]|uniref:teleost multiple tissue opsin 3a n=1 Tax=Corythoichthys intestinalis TaxID=161448 RepID=UPI0025A6378B|nr:teleost multiple tissue opsin 3a [Corythoichthys intestinalis]
MVVHIRVSHNFSTLNSSLPPEPPDSAARGVGEADAPGGLSRGGHTAVAVCLGIILVAGIVNNSLTLLVFARFRCLWTPINVILLNISLSDVLVCVFGTPLSFAASVHGRWLIGEFGCRWYGFANSFFGIVSLVSLSVLSYERYTTVLRSSQVDISNFRKAWLCIGGCWLYALFWTMPPLLGWSSYGPEGPGTTCSVQWHLRSPGSVSYVLCLFIFCLLLPLLLMVYSYGCILVTIRRMGKLNPLTAQRREHRILRMVLTLVSCYLLCWMPYGVVALVTTFGSSQLVAPSTSVVPSVLAKFSTVINPIIYVFFNNQFSRCLVAFVKCKAKPPSVQAAQPGLRSQSSPWLHDLFPGIRRRHSLANATDPSLDGSRRALVVHYTPPGPFRTVSLQTDKR